MTVNDARNRNVPIVLHLSAKATSIQMMAAQNAHFVCGIADAFLRTISNRDE